MKFIKAVKNKKKKLNRTKQIDTAKKVAAGAAVGSAIGAAAGVLLAPKSGKETREDIAEGAKEAVGKSKSAINEAKDSVTQKIEEIEDDVKGKVNKIAGDVKKSTNKTK